MRDMGIVPSGHVKAPERLPVFPIDSLENGPQILSPVP